MAALGRLARRGGRGAGAVRPGRHAPGQCRPVPREVREYYEGFCNATLWPLYHDVIAPARVPPGVVDAYAPGQPPLRGGGGRAGRTRRDRMGARLPAPAGPGHAPRAARRRADRLLHPHPVPRLEHLRQLPWRRQIVGACSARTSSASSAQRRHQLPAGLPAQCQAGHPRLDHVLDPLTAGASGPERRSARAAREAHRARGGDFQMLARGAGRHVPDLDRRAELDEIARRAGSPARVARKSGRRWATAYRAARRRPARLHQGHLHRRLQAFAELLAEGALELRRLRASCRSPCPPASASSTTEQLRDEVERAVGRINGEYGEVGLSPSTTCTARIRARSSPRSTWRPT